MKPMLLLVAALLALASAASAADPAAPALRTSPDLAEGVQAFPPVGRRYEGRRCNQPGAG